MTESSQNKHWQVFSDAIREHFWVSLHLPDTFISDLVPTHGIAVGTEHFGEGGIFEPIAAYGLELGRRDVDAGLSEISLREYFERWPHKPNMFQYIDRSNGYSAQAGIIARTRNLLISMQWSIDSGLFSEGRKLHDFTPFYLSAFNEYGVPLLEFQAESSSKAIIVFSDFREHCYLASTEQDYWDTNASEEQVLTPLPTGMGLVGNWSATSSNDDMHWNEFSLLGSRLDTQAPDLLVSSYRFLQELVAVDNKRRI